MNEAAALSAADFFARFAEIYRSLHATEGAVRPDAPLVEELERCARAVHAATLSALPGGAGGLPLEALAKEAAARYLAAESGKPRGLREAMDAFIAASDAVWQGFISSEAGARALGTSFDAWIASLEPAGGRR